MEYITTRQPGLVASADQEGRVLIRGFRGRPVNFFLIEDYLRAETGADQAEYFQQIEGFEVEGREVVKRDVKVVDSWMLQGDRDYDTRIKGKQPETAADPLAALIAALGGPEAVRALFAQQLLGQAANLNATAEAQTAAAEAAKVKAEADRPWLVTDLLNVPEDEVRLLSAEYLPHMDHATSHRSALCTALAKHANTNPNLSNQLDKLVK